jgi:hypothetical protein
MRRCVFVLTLALLIVPGIMLGRGSVGIGLQLGEPTGLSAKFWTGRSNAVDAVLGWNLISNKFTVQAGYLWHFPQPVPQGSFALYAGAGGALGGGSDRDDGTAYLFLAGRVPLGLEYIFSGAPIGLYAEIDPMLRLLPAIGLSFGAGIGIRFYP